jgi:hypothetical protein
MIRRSSASLRLLTFALAAAFASTLALPTEAWAWGRIGHRVSAQLTEKRLNPKAKAAIAAILPPGSTLADASTWPDEHRRELPETAPWHYIDVPLDEPRYDSRFSGDSPEKGCIVDKIAEMRARLKDPSKSVEDRRFALRFLVHLVEDLHMPMHVGDNSDKGGNRTQIRFFEDGSNMHRLWDSDMIERVSKDEAAWIADLGKVDTPEAFTAAVKGTVEDWATESILASRAAYEIFGVGRLKSGQKLGQDYFDRSLPVVRDRLYKSGVRLAEMLNEALGQ